MKLASTLLLLLLLVSNVRTVSGVESSTRRTNKKAAQPVHQTQAATAPENSDEQQRIALDRQKHSDEMAFKRDDLALRREQLADQKSQRIWTVLGTVIPLLAVLFTIIYNAWIFRKQTQQSNKQRGEDAILQFELKAAEIAFAGDTPSVVRDRANALKAMFKERLSSSFLTDYDPAEFGEREGSVESKKFFLKLLLEYSNPRDQYEVLCFWKELFPGDVDWLDRINLSPHPLPHNSSASIKQNE